MTSPDRKEASCKGSPWEREACFRKVLYGARQEKQDAAAFGGRSRHQFWTAGEEKKAGSTPGNSYGCLAGIGRHGSLLSPGCFICRTGVKAGKTPLNGPGRGQKGKDGGFSHADEQACSRYVWRRTLPPGGTSASRPPWPCFSNGTYFP